MEEAMPINKKLILLQLLLGLIICGCSTIKDDIKDSSSVEAKIFKRETLSAIFKEYFQEDAIYIDEENSKDKVNIKKLWNALGIKKEEVSSKVDDGAKERLLFGADEFDRPSIRYRTYTSHLATDTQDEYVILEFSEFNSDYELLLFKKEGEDWVYVTHEVIRENGGYELDLQFLKTDDNTLLFSIVETGGRGTDFFSNDYVFYKLIDGKLKQVLTTLKSGYQEGRWMFFKREYEAQMWPFFFSSPSIGFTYYITFQGDSFYYDSKFKDVPRFFILFTMKKNVLFNWDPKISQYVLDKKSSQLSEEEMRAISDDGREQFYAKNKARIDSLKHFGTERQKEWAQLFERITTGKTELGWDEKAGTYVEIPKVATP
jgi:hypothetical protein